VSPYKRTGGTKRVPRGTNRVAEDFFWKKHSPNKEMGEIDKIGRYFEKKFTASRVKFAHEKRPPCGDLSFDISNVF